MSTPRAQMTAGVPQGAPSGTSSTKKPPRRRGDQKGRPTSKNLPPPFLTSCATIEQRTAVYDHGEMLSLEDNKSPQRRLLMRSPSPAGGVTDGTGNRHRASPGSTPVPPKSQTPALPAIAPNPQSRFLVVSGGGTGNDAGTTESQRSGRRRSNTHQPSSTTTATAKVGGGLPRRDTSSATATAPSAGTVRQRLLRSPVRTDQDDAAAVREAEAQRLVEDTKQQGTKPVPRSAVSKLDDVYRDEDTGYAAFLQRRGPVAARGAPTHPAPTPGLPRIISPQQQQQQQQHVATTPSRATPAMHALIAETAAQNAATAPPRAGAAPLSRHTTSASAASVGPRNSNHYSDVQHRSPRRPFAAPIGTAAAGGVEPPSLAAQSKLPTLSQPDDEDLISHYGRRPDTTSGLADSTQRRTLQPLATSVATLRDSARSPHLVTKLTDVALLRSVNSSLGGSGFATRFRVDAAEVDFAPSPTALSKTGVGLAPSTRSATATPMSPETVTTMGGGVTASSSDHASAVESERIRREHRRQVALRTIALATAPSPGGTNAYAGGGYDESPPLTQDQSSSSPAAGGAYAGEGYYSGESGVESSTAESRWSVAATQGGENCAGLLTSSTARAEAPSSDRAKGGHSPSGVQDFRLRLARQQQELARLASPATADDHAPPSSQLPQPARLSFLVLAEQLQAERATVVAVVAGVASPPAPSSPLGATATGSAGAHVSLNGSVQYTVTSPAVTSPHAQPASGAALGASFAPSALDLTQTNLAGSLLTNGSLAKTVSMVLNYSLTSPDSTAPGEADEDPESRYQSEVAALAEAEYWRALRGSRAGTSSGSGVTGTSTAGGSSVTQSRRSHHHHAPAIRRATDKAAEAAQNAGAAHPFGPIVTTPDEGVNGGVAAARRRVGVESMRRSTIDVAGCHRPWNDAFQALLERPCATSQESLERAKSIRRLCGMFKDAMTPVIEAIVLERGLTDDVRQVKLQSVGGIIGGDKYAIGNIFLKYCGSSRAVSSKLYGEHGWALKSATNELKGLNALIRANVRHLHVPLGMTATFLGQRLWVSSRLPIDGARTLRFGSQDAGITVRTDDAPSRVMAATAAGALNLKPHRVGQAVVPTPVDLEIHLGDDGRYYVCDTARLFPPDANPASGLPKNYHLHKVLRPERVHENAEAALSSDALCRLGQRDPDFPTHDREVVEASLAITVSCIPMLTHQLGNIFLAEGERRIGGGAKMNAAAAAVSVSKKNPTASGVTAALLTESAAPTLKKAMHDYGINLRYLGRLLDEYVTWSARAAQPLPVTVVCTTIVAEIIARSFKSVVNTQFNDFTSTTAAPGGGDDGLLQASDIASYHHLLVEFYERLFAGTGESRLFWALALMPMVMRKFKCGNETLEVIYSCFSRATIEAPWVSATHLHGLVFKRVNELLGVSWHLNYDRDRDFIGRLGGGGTSSSHHLTSSATTALSSPTATSDYTGASQPPLFSMPLLKHLAPVVKVCDMSPFASVAELIERHELERAELLYLDEVEIRSLTLGETPALAPLLTNLADLYASWQGREADELNLRSRIVLIYQNAWDSVIAANSTDFAGFFTDADGNAVADPEAVLKALPRSDIARASGCTRLLPLTPPYVAALNQLGRCLLQLHRVEESIEALSTSARMAVARLAVAVYANPFRVIAEQIQHDERPPQRVSSLAPMMASMSTADETEFASMISASAAAAIAAENGGTTLQSSPAPFVIAPVERAALEAELEWHSLATRRFLADAYVAAGALPDALAQRHAAIVTSRRLCERQSEQVMALAASVLSFRSDASSASPRGPPAAAPKQHHTTPVTEVGLRAMLAEVGLPMTADKMSAPNRYVGVDGIATRSAGTAVALYCAALRELSTTLALAGRTKLACGAADEALRVTLDPVSSIRSGSAGYGRPDAASPMHQPSALAWLRAVMAKATHATGREALELLIGFQNGSGGGGGAPNGAAAAQSSTLLAPLLNSNSTAPSDVESRNQRRAIFDSAARALSTDDRELVDNLIDADTLIPSRPLSSALTETDLAETVLAAVEARFEDCAFVGDAAMVLPAAIEAFVVLLTAARPPASTDPVNSSRVTAAPTSSFKDLCTPPMCRAALIIGRLLLRVGAHREGVRLLQRCLHAARHMHEGHVRRGLQRHSSALLVAECCLHSAEVAVLPAIELELFLPVPESALKTSMQAHAHAQAQDGTDANNSPAVPPLGGSHRAQSPGPQSTSRARPHHHQHHNTTASPSDQPHGSVSRLLEAQQYLTEGLRNVAECNAGTGRECSGPIAGRLNAVLAAVRLMARTTCSFVPAFTAPLGAAPQQPAAAANGTTGGGGRDDLVLTRFTSATAGMSRYGAAAAGLVEVKHAAAVAQLALDQSGDNASRYRCLALCVQGLAAIMPLSDAAVLADVMAAEFRLVAAKRASNGRSAPSQAMTEAPSPLGVATVLCELHGIVPASDDVAGDDGNLLRSPSRLMRQGSPTRCLSPEGSGFTAGEAPHEKMLRHVLSGSFDLFFRALATSDEHMSSDMLDCLSRRCVNHATYLESRLGIAHRAPAVRAAAGGAVSGGGGLPPLGSGNNVPPAAAAGAGRRNGNAPDGGGGSTIPAAAAASSVPLSRGCQKRRLQMLLALAPVQIQHGEVTAGIATARTALSLFRELFPLRTPWDPLVGTLLVSLRSLGSWLVRSQPIGPDRELGATLMRIADRETEKRDAFRAGLAASAEASTESQEQEAFVARQQRLSAQLQQITLFARLQRVENVRCMLLHALDDFAALYPRGADGEHPHSIQTHNELVQHVRTLRRLMGVPQSVMDAAVKAFAVSGQGTPAFASAAGTPRLSARPRSGGGAPAWQQFARGALAESTATANRLGAAFSTATVATAAADAQALAAAYSHFEGVVNHALSTLYDLRTLGPSFDGHASAMTDLHRRHQHRLEAFTM
jgi:hypothetical protein